MGNTVRRIVVLAVGASFFWFFLLPVAKAIGIPVGLPTISFGGGPPKTAPGKSGYGAKILAEARKHDNEPYVFGGGHPPSGYKNGSGLDCSGLVNVAVLRVAGVGQEILAQKYPEHPEHWTPVKFKDIKPGDIVYHVGGPAGGHVAIVVKYKGHGKVDLFGAWTDEVGFKDQISLHVNDNLDWYTGAMRFHK